MGDPSLRDRVLSEEMDRLAVALAAWWAGYFLLDTIEVDAGESFTGPGWRRVWDLAAATEVGRVFAHGVDAVHLEPMAGELRLTVRRVDVEVPEASGVTTGPKGWAAAG